MVENHRPDSRFLSFTYRYSCHDGSLTNCLNPSFEKISAFDQRAHLAIHHAPPQHPEPAVGMNVMQPVGSQYGGDVLNAGGDQLRAFDLVVLNVDHAYSQPDIRVEVGKNFQFVVPAPGKLEHQVIRMKRIQKGNQIAPEPAKLRLSSI